MKIRLTDVLSRQKVIITNQYGCCCLQVSEFISVQSLSRVEPDETGFNRKVIGHVQSKTPAPTTHSSGLALLPWRVLLVGGW